MEALCCQVGEVSYHDFPGIKLDEEAKDSLINSFGSASRVWLIPCFHNSNEEMILTVITVMIKPEKFVEALDKLHVFN